MTNQPLKPLTPTVSLPVRQLTNKDDINDIKPLEYIKIAYYDSVIEHTRHSDGFFGGTFNVKGTDYFTLVHPINHADPDMINLTSYLYSADGFRLRNEYGMEASTGKRDDLENIMSNHLNKLKERTSDELNKDMASKTIRVSNNIRHGEEF